MKTELVLDVSRETQDRLDRFASLVRKWSPKINLVSPRSLDELWTRHITDSAQLLRFAPQWASSWLDLGSGGGFPGVVVSILSAETRSSLQTTLVESDARKAAFLRTAVHDLGLQTVVHHARVETLPPQNADIVSARALAPLDRLIPLVWRHLSRNGCALLPKGRTVQVEIDTARQHFDFEFRRHPSQTDPDSVILEVEPRRDA